MLAILKTSGEASTSPQTAPMFCPAEQRAGFKLHHSNLSVTAPEDTKSQLPLASLCQIGDRNSAKQKLTNDFRGFRGSAVAWLHAFEENTWYQESEPERAVHLVATQEAERWDCRPQASLLQLSSLLSMPFFHRMGLITFRASLSHSVNALRKPRANTHRDVPLQSPMRF